MKLTTTTNLLWKNFVYFTSYQSRFYLSSIFILFTFFSAFSQSENDSEWELNKSQDGINVFSKRIMCDVQGSPNPFEYIVYKVENTTNSSLTFDLRFEIYFEEGCNGCNGSGETSRNLTLLPGQMVEANCENPTERLSYFIHNPGFSGSWNYTHSVVFINVNQ